MRNRDGDRPDIHLVADRVSDAASVALRRIASLAATAPSGRLFDAISTLTELSRGIESELDAGNRQMEAGRIDQVTMHFARAVIGLEDLTKAATSEPAPAELPDYLRKRR